LAAILLFLISIEFLQIKLTEVLPVIVGLAVCGDGQPRLLLVEQDLE
jgi:hypothetical protein